MDDAFFEEIAKQIKGYHNHAIKQIEKKRYRLANEYYQKAWQITASIKYYHGMAMTLYNMANLEVLQEDLPQAIVYAARSKEYHQKANVPTQPCDQLLSKLGMSALKKGMSFEKNGELIKALAHYEVALPYVEDRLKKAVKDEMEQIERILYNGKRKDCTNHDQNQPNGHERDSKSQI